MYVVVASDGASTIAPAAVITTSNVLDPMNRTVVHGFGRAALGGVWTASAEAASFSVSPTGGHIGAVAAGHQAATDLRSVIAQNVDVRAMISLPKLPATGGGVYFGLATRESPTHNAVVAQIHVTTAGRATLNTYVLRSGTRTVLGATILTPTIVHAGTTYNLETRTFGATVSARFWRVSQATPAWQMSRTLPLTASTRNAGSVGLKFYVASTTPASSVLVRKFEGWQSVTATAPPAVAPTTAPPAVAPTTAPPAAAPTTAPPAAAPTPTTSPKPAAPVVSPARPGPTNTGVPGGQILTVHAGDMAITQAGATYTNLDIRGFVFVYAPNVTIKNSIIRGGVATSGNVGIVTDTDARGTNFVIEDSEIVPQYPSVYIDGIKGWNYTLNRVDIHGTVDTAKVYGDNATIQNSWLHDTVPYAQDPNQGNGPSHNDGVQVLSGSNIHILDNTIGGGTNSALQVTQGNGAVSNLWFDGNWVDGGACTVNVNNVPMPSMTGINLADNRFGHATRIANCPVVIATATQFTGSGNVFDDTSAPVPVRRG